jgi:hypothetical protein
VLYAEAIGGSCIAFVVGRWFP